MKSLLKYLLSLVMGVLLTLLILPYYFAAAGDSYAPPAQIIPSQSLLEEEQVFSQIYGTVAPSVVAINFALKLEGQELFTPLGSGSGFVIDNQGHIVTNSHVIQFPDDMMEALQLTGEEESRVEVRFYDGTIVAAEIVGIDDDSDLAVLRVNIDGQRLRPVTFADSNNLRVGQVVLALGNPFSNDWTMTSGIISALNRSIVGLNSYSIGGVIQTDAAINPGNSGGPLVNLQGQVIGVNSQINTESGSNSGIGFAIPSNLVYKVSQALIQNGVVQYSFIGILSRPVDLNLMDYFGLPNNLRGVAILQVIDGAPAEAAGLRSLSNNSVDIITALNGRPVADFDEMIGYLAINTNPGDPVILSIYRDGNIFDVTVTLTNRPTVEESAED